MMPSQFTKPFDYFKQIVKQMYPQVTQLECDNWCDNVQPIKYDDAGFERTEYPPVVSWRIGERRYRYVLAPKLKTTYYSDIVGVLCGSTIRTNVDYQDQEKIVSTLIRWSVEGKSTEEMNILLDGLRIRNGF